MWNYFQKEPKQPAPSSNETPYHDQRQKVKQLLRADKLINEARLDFETDWFYDNLGIDKYYFETYTAEDIAHHISSLYAAKTLSQLNGTELEVKLHNKTSGKALFMARSLPGVRGGPSEAIEYRIEKDYLGEGYHEKSGVAPPTKRHIVQCYRTSGSISPENSDMKLRMFFVSEPQFKVANAAESNYNLDEIADKELLKQIDDKTKTLYTDALKSAVTKLGPVVQLHKTEHETLLMIVYRSNTTHSFFSGITDLYHAFGWSSTKKFVDVFSNGFTGFRIYFGKKDVSDSQIHKLISEADLIYILPRTSLTPLLKQGKLGVKEHAYAYAAWKFAFHFLSRQSSEFAELAATLKNDPIGARLLDQIKSAVRKEAYTEGRLMEAVASFPNLVVELYADFEKCQHHKGENPANSELLGKIQKTVISELDRLVLQAFYTFNRHVLKTNFYKPSKVALSFRLNPGFLSKAEYPTTPFGMFFVVGSEFRGFHVRFRDIARGGIRIIRSANFQAFTHNVSTMFAENYNLAHTQERKNKDIAEGGSKGTILLSLDHQDRATAAFQKYVDALMDLLLPNGSIVDHYGKQEILFLGPDEGTANYMDWASLHARDRGYAFWKSFTTGKSLKFGGIPHDLFGMTTRGIHQYVLGVLEKLNLKEENCTKFQTGGPDGDLGSNEILISKDKTVGIVDGSGVLYDPHGIAREAMEWCARERKMVVHFDKSKLSKDGFFVSIEDSDIKLPDGTLIASGLDFRNSFHLSKYAKADVFVPCGGRPEAVNLSNVSSLFEEGTKKPKFPIIVEGANLFFTQDARLILEKAGVVLFKDASANKGGVTSSSLEVLAALSLADEEFSKYMAVTDEKFPPKFYSDYVKEVHRVIEENARMEFECIWKASKETGTHNSILSDQLSNKINELSQFISDSNLWDNISLRKKVFEAAVPKNLMELLGFEKIMERIPIAYAKAMFGTYLASRYVYQCGLNSNPEFAFYNFLSEKTK